MPKLGILNGREYHEDKGKIFWKIPDLRECVKTKPGWVVLCSDLSQIEVKLMAFFSQDPFLIGAINSGKDIHSFMACEIFEQELAWLSTDFEERYTKFTQIIDGLLKSDRKDELKELRTGVKRVTFGIPYGAGAGKIGMMIQRRDKKGRPVETIEDATIRAEGIIERYFKKASVLKLWLDKVREVAVLTGESRSLRGRIRTYISVELGILEPEKTYRDKEGNVRTKYKHQYAFKFKNQIERWAGNHPIQGSCTDLLKMALYNIWLRLRGGNPSARPNPEAFFMLCVHDEIVMTCPAQHAGTVKRIMEEEMARAYNDAWMDIDGIRHDLSEIKNVITVAVGDHWVKD